MFNFHMTLFSLRLYLLATQRLHNYFLRTLTEVLASTLHSALFCTMSVHCLVFANAARVCRLFSECVNTAHYCRTQSSVVSGWRRASTFHRPRTPFHCTWRPAPSPLTHAHLESHSADIISATGRRAAEDMETHTLLRLDIYKN